MKATVAMNPDSRPEALRSELLCLLETCPAEYCNPDGCPLHGLRALKYSERLDWFNALSEEDLVFLATYHAVCFALKLDEKLLAANWESARPPAAR